ncbi:MAG TPA: hypothetical protein QGG47_06395 [Acidobacteriota bacterium]|nr:hypothetical protein [Acidobacteriota bacterium]
MSQLPPRLLTDTSGAALPFESDAGVLEFLRSAEIVSQSRYDEGGRPIAFDDADEFGRGTYLLRLRQGDLELDAIFRSIEDRLGVARFVDGSTEVHFRDSGLFECAAYELSAMLGLFQVPPAVRRRIGPVEGSLQIVAPTWFSESDRVTGGLADPSSQRWNKQLATMNVFDALIANPDRNRRNLLYDETWRLWITDHSRAFRVSTRLDEAPLQAIERSFWVSLGGLESGAISDAVSAYLSDGELSALLERRDRLVAHFESLIEQRGEPMVMFGY